MRSSLNPYLACLLVASALVAPSPAAAQVEEGPDPSKVRLRLGPLWMNPTIALTNLGLDTNVFNEPPSTPPKRDYTATLTPGTQLWLRMGRTWLDGNIKEDLVWYQKYKSERSANNDYTLAWKIPLNRVNFSFTGNWRDTRSRPDLEIDARVDHRELGSNGLAEVRALSKTYFGVRAEYAVVDYDQNAVVAGVSLRNQLNHETRRGSITIRHQLTPLTSITASVSHAEDRFGHSPLRNSQNDSADVTLRFEPAALLRGSASFGYSEFRPDFSTVPLFRGTTAAVDLTYVLLGSTRFAVQGARAVQYSYEVPQPYFLQTGGNFMVAQQIYGPLDVVVRAGTQWLEYRSQAGVIALEPNRTDRYLTYGGGFGYHLGKELRIGVNVDQEERRSPLPLHRYKGLKIGAAVTFGL